MRKIVICLMTAVLAAAAAFFALEDMGPFSFYLPTEGGGERIPVAEKANGEYYVFLPGFCELENLELWSLLPIRLDGEKFSGSHLELDRPYDLQSRDRTGTLTFLQSKNLGALYIDTASGDMDYVHREKGNKSPGHLRLYSPDGTLDSRGDLGHIKARGNSTFTFAAKKAYSLELAQETDLLGMGAAQKWILLADAFDPSHLRNKIVYDFAGAAGLPYSPDSRWVDLYLNGEYAGLYLLTECNEIHHERVDIDPAGFLVSSEAPDRMEDLPHITLDSGTVLRIHQSGWDEHQLKNLWQSAENAILAADGVDSISGKHWRDLIDLDTWARKYLIEEIFANYDGGSLSQFYYLEDGKICAGPVWDYDYAIANREIYPAPAPNMFYVNQPYERHGGRWFGKLYRDPEFYSCVTNLYRTEFRPLLEELATRKIYEYSDTISRAAYEDCLLWDTDSPGEEGAAIGVYLAGRLEFLDRVWLNGEEYIEVPANFGGRWANYILFPGDTLPPLPQREGDSWYITGTDQRLDESQPVYEQIEIELREDLGALEKE